MRPDARRHLRPDWRRYWRPAHRNYRSFKLYEQMEQKFSSDQPRVPAGSREGGQWTKDGGSRGGGSDNRPLTDKPGSRIAARISPQRRKDCEEQYRDDTFICNIMGTASCWRQAAFRLSQCLIGGDAPPFIIEALRWYSRAAYRYCATEAMKSKFRFAFTLRKSIKRCLVLSL